MTDHAPLPVAGYTSQPTTRIDLVNINKIMEERCLRVLDELKMDRSVDQRWLAVGRTHLEQAWMAINRSIFNPTRIQVAE